MSNSPRDPGSSNSNQAPGTKQNAGCWLWVPLGCLAILIIGGVFVAIGLRTAIKSTGGAKSFSNALDSTLQNEARVTDAMQKMKLINAAVNKYNHDNHTYPATLSQLVPNYIPSAASLHSIVDSNPSPAHITFVYHQPPNGAPPLTLYLSVTDTYQMSIGTTTQTIATTITMSLDGNIVQQNIQQGSTPPSGSITNPGSTQ